MEAALRARIVGATAAADRVYWVDRPQGTALPSITLQTISGDHPYLQDGALEATRDPRVQLDVWGNSYAEAKSIIDAVIAELSVGETSNGITFESIRFENERDGLERLETKNVYRRGIDLIVWHHPA